MTFNRDIKVDRKQTNIEILKNKKALFHGKSWLGHTKDCGIIDHELLNGATQEELIKRSGRQQRGVEVHIYHLKSEHGLMISKINEIYKLEYYHPETNRMIAETDLQNLMNIDIEKVTRLCIVQLENDEGSIKWYSIGIETPKKDDEEVTSLDESKGFAKSLLDKKVEDYVNFGKGFKILTIKKYLSK